MLFDMDGVLVDYQPRLRVAHLAERLGRTVEAVEQAIYASGIEAAADAGQLDARGYLAALGQALDTTVQVADWVAARRAATRPRADHLHAVEQLASRFTLAVLTNNGLLLAERWNQITPDLFPLFEGRAFAAASFGVAKPDPRVYLACLRELGVAPGQTLFIDDHPANVDGARQAGLDALHYTDAGGFFARLAAL